jgi:hypothetical protein
MRSAALVASVVLLGLPYSAFAQPGSDCPADRSSAQSEKQLLSKYRRAVFKVYSVKRQADGKESQIPLGTATLVDLRGYFLTASHIFDNSPNEFPGDGPWPAPYQGQLKVANLELGIVLNGKEVAHRRRRNDPDLSILFAEIPEPIKQVLTPVDPFLGIPNRDDQVLMVGYPADSDSPLSHLLLGIGGVQKATTLIVLGTAFSGESGSLAIGLTGSGVGILHGWDEPEKTKIVFTLPAAGEDLFETIDQSQRVKKFLAGLEAAKLDAASAVILEAFAFSNLELLKIFRTVVAAPSRFKKGLGVYAKMLYDAFSCNGLRDHAWRFAIAVGPSLSAQTLLDASRAAVSAYASLGEAGAADVEKSQRLSGALALFRSYEAKGDLRNARISSAFRSDVSAEYAAVLLEANGLGIKVGEKDVRVEFWKQAATSAKLNPKNWTPYSLAAQMLRVDGKSEDAAKAAAAAYYIASTEYSSKAADLRSLEGMWRASVGDAIAKLPAQDPSRELLEAQLNLGVGQAGMFAVMGLEGGGKSSLAIK